MIMSRSTLFFTITALQNVSSECFFIIIQVQSVCIVFIGILLVLLRRNISSHVPQKHV